MHCPPAHIPYSPHTVGKAQSSGYFLITSDTMVHFSSDHSYSLKCPSYSNLMYWMDFASGSAIMASGFPACVDCRKMLRLPFVKVTLVGSFLLLFVSTKYV
ncbi:Os04g0302300 [Oryza sativa Japonica Group]|uniref:Os04g0302300 protein n=2 Tax=Oryza sativa subsp. japonica TaxID=39947 RepID=Q0JEB5_ORYSJ|nr:hypothetical protein EE612_022976 [Oryza sativa]BAF14322.1 Os04g0302300 [Oryza sativa Japonica Group]BAS88469.1 Os04g0302300 [Oryza sativa Japonica Group]|eukprot:NP_001052408.1 Os04g0302300 [Oryza sativa Japonica Group]